MIPKIKWPGGKDFAFTIFDDPDLDTVENIATIYSFLGDLGLRTTKAVWPIRGNGTPKIGGRTCEDEQYFKWVLELKEQGFELASSPKVLGALYKHTAERANHLRLNRRTRLGLRTLFTSQDMVVDSIDGEVWTSGLVWQAP